MIGPTYLCRDTAISVELGRTKAGTLERDTGQLPHQQQPDDEKPRQRSFDAIGGHAARTSTMLSLSERTIDTNSVA